MENRGVATEEVASGKKVWANLICCPIDHGGLTESPEGLKCLVCNTAYPVLSGRPVLIDESRSLFSNSDISDAKEKKHFAEVSGWKARLRHLLPANPQQRDRTPAMQKLRKMLPDNANVLIVGAGFSGDFYREVFSNGKTVVTDITLKGGADIACDGHCLPFYEKSFDLVITDQVLEHVAFPWQVTAEINRCLKPGGIVYSGIPFYLPVHGIPYDFQRFTPAGHRMLYPELQVVELFTTGGPVGGLALTLIGCTTAISTNVWWRRITSFIIRLFAKIFSFVDYLLRNRKTSSTIPLSTVFIGRKDGNKRHPAEMFREVNSFITYS